RRDRAPAPVPRRGGAGPGTRASAWSCRRRWAPAGRRRVHRSRRSPRAAPAGRRTACSRRGGPAARGAGSTTAAEGDRPDRIRPRAGVVPSPPPRPGSKAGIVLRVPDVALSEAEARFDRRRRAVGLVLAPVTLVGLIALPMPSLSPQAHMLAGVAAMTVVLWVTEAIPLAAAALL